MSKDLINWHELSRILSGNGQNIRPNKVPKKYEKQVNSLFKMVEPWLKTNKMSDYKITNRVLFRDTVEDIEINTHNFNGEVVVNGETYSGQYEPDDFEEEYGFVMVE